MVGETEPVYVVGRCKPYARDSESPRLLANKPQSGDAPENQQRSAEHRQQDRQAHDQTATSGAPMVNPSTRGAGTPSEPSGRRRHHITTAEMHIVIRPSAVARPSS